MKQFVVPVSLAFTSAALALSPVDATADSGFYIGGSIGNATIEARFAEVGIPEFPLGIDEDETALKAFAGYSFDLLVIDLGIEAGYVDFGEPAINVMGDDLEFDTTGVNLWGIAALEAGPVDLFAKLGYIAWDVETSFQGSSITDDGSDLGYGLGLSIGLGGLRVRGEYEVYDLDDTDLSMISLGLSYQFD